MRWGLRWRDHFVGGYWKSGGLANILLSGGGLPDRGCDHWPHIHGSPQSRRW